MITELEIGGVSVDVIRKDIKNLHLSVYPPTGRVRIAAPSRISLEAIRAFAITRLAWIRRNQRKVIMQEREPPREYIDRESHYVWGERVMLKLVERDLPSVVSLKHRTLTMQVRTNTDVGSRERLLEGWYREELRNRALPSLEKWQSHLGVKASALFVQRMKTKWGSCNPHSGNIRLNTDLAKKPVECLDYVILHELAHLRVRLHTAEYFLLLDYALPQWREIRQTLNLLPLKTELVA
jgi:predicted metal-dependent hydrolase